MDLVLSSKYKWSSPSVIVSYYEHGSQISSLRVKIWVLHPFSYEFTNKFYIAQIGRFL